MKIALRVLVTALALLIVSYLLDKVIVESIYIAIISAIIIGLCNLTVRPILVVLTLPITLLTLGLFLFVINAFILLFVSSFIEGFAIDGFLTALLASLIISFISSIGNKFIVDKD